MKRAAPHAINHALLPGRLRDLVRVLGERLAFDLVQKRGGTRLIVPKRVSAPHPLLDALGLPGFIALVDAYGGEVIDDLPKYDSVARQLRHERVRQMRATDQTIDQVAMATNYSRRQVMNILAADGPDDRQYALFDGTDGPGDATEDAAPVPPDTRPENFAGQANDPFGLGTRRR